MESLKIYDESHKELIQIRRSMGFDSVTINLSKLDEQSKNELVQAINNVVSDRIKKVESVILGVN